jgi:transcriptional regulator with XRE-family HTH domain
MKIERVNLGEIVRQKVEEKGLSQAEFAKRIGIARQNVVKLVFAKASLDTNLVCRISEELGCNLFDYFKSNTANDKTELKATITIEIGKEKKDRTVRFVFGENDIEILNK